MEDLSGTFSNLIREVFSYWFVRALLYPKMTPRTYNLSSLNEEEERLSVSNRERKTQRRAPQRAYETREKIERNPRATLNSLFISKLYIIGLKLILPRLDEHSSLRQQRRRSLQLVSKHVEIVFFQLFQPPLRRRRLQQQFSHVRILFTELVFREISFRKASIFSKGIKARERVKGRARTCMYREGPVADSS